MTNEDLQGPSISIPVLSSQFHARDVPAFINQFTIRSNTNNWSTTRALSSLLLILSEELCELVQGVNNVKEAFDKIIKFFFPTTDFFFYQKKMKNL